MQTSDSTTSNPKGLFHRAPAQRALFTFLLALTAPGAAPAQSVLVTHYSQNGGGHVAAFDAVDGELRSASFIDFTGTPTNGPHQVVAVGADWWVTDPSNENAHVWSHTGTVYLGDELEGPTGDILGAVEAFGATWFCAQGPPFVPGELIEVRGGVETAHTLTIDSPHGIGVFNGELIVTHGGGAIRVDPATGIVLGNLFSSAAQEGMQQPMVRPSTGNLLVPRQASRQDIVELDANGAIVAEFDVNALLGIFAPFACVELASGDLLISSEAGVHIVDAGFTTARRVLEGVRGRFLTVAPDVTIGTNYCGPAVLNSTGLPARIGATGSSVANDRALRLSAHDMPLHSSGYFLVSQTQGNVVQPGGSTGTLCLGGSIGRFVLQIRNSSTVGFIEIEVDTNAIAQPNGSPPILAGQTWNWQAWYRDSIGGQATSNFTDAISIPFS
jgi:hypothetical protein